MDLFGGATSRAIFNQRPTHRQTDKQNRFFEIRQVIMTWYPSSYCINNSCTIVLQSSNQSIKQWIIYLFEMLATVFRGVVVFVRPHRRLFSMQRANSSFNL
jgi:hypothetical protein